MAPHGVAIRCVMGNDSAGKILEMAASGHDIHLRCLIPSIPFCATIYCLYAANQISPHWCRSVSANGHLFWRHAVFCVGAIRRTNAVLYIGTLCFVAANTMLDPFTEKLDSAREFVLSAEAIRSAQHAKLLFYNLRPDGLAIKYMVNVSDATVPLFLNAKQDLKLAMPPVVVYCRGGVFFKITTWVAATVLPWC